MRKKNETSKNVKTSRNIPVHLSIAAFLLRCDKHWKYVENNTGNILEF